jgi:hypothetical protein
MHPAKFPASLKLYLWSCHGKNADQHNMSALKSLTFTTIPKIGANPTLDRRTNIIARLEEQKLLLNDPNYIRTVRSWVKSAHAGRQAAARLALMAGERERVVCLLCSIRIETD